MVQFQHEVEDTHHSCPLMHTKKGFCYLFQIIFFFFLRLFYSSGLVFACVILLKLSLFFYLQVRLCAYLWEFLLSVLYFFNFSFPYQL